MIIYLLIFIGVVAFIGAVLLVARNTEASICPKCGSEMEFWSSRAKDLICQNKKCKYSIKLW